MSYPRFNPANNGLHNPENMYNAYENSFSSPTYSNTQTPMKDIIIRNLPSYANERTIEQMIISQGFKPVATRVDRVYNPLGYHFVEATVKFDSLMNAQAWITINQGVMKFNDGTMCPLEMTTESPVNKRPRFPSPENKGEEPMRMSSTPESDDQYSITGDWKCKRCSFNNFCGMTVCGSCLLQKQISDVYETLPDRTKISENVSAMAGVPLLPGMHSISSDTISSAAVLPKQSVKWSCPQCGGSNSENVESCKRCKQPAYGANMVGNVPCDTVLLYDLSSEASEIKIKMKLEDYKHQSVRIHLVSEKKYCLVQMPSVDEAKATVRDFNRSAPKIGHRKILVAFSRKPLNAILMEQRLEAYRNQAMLKTQNALMKKAFVNPELKNPLIAAQLIKEATSSSPGPSNASSNSPKTDYLHFDRTSGYFYDPSNGYYYDAKSESFYNPVQQDWLFWSTKSGNYKSFNSPTAHNSMSQEMLRQQSETQKYIQKLHSIDCKLTGQSVSIACEMFRIFMNQSRFIYQLFADKITEDSHREALQNFEWQMLELRQAVALDMYRQNAPPPPASDDILPPPRMDLQVFTPLNMRPLTPDSLTNDEQEENSYKLITGMDSLSIQLRHLVPDGNVRKEDLRLCRKCGRVGHTKLTCQYGNEADEETIAYMSKLIDAYKKIHRIEDTKEEKAKLVTPIGSATGDTNMKYLLNLQEAFKTPESRVVHVRNLRPEVTEPELKKLLIHFGKIFDIYILPSTKSNHGQALVEFETLEDARACVRYSAPIIIMGQRVYFEYGNRQRITKPPPQPIQPPKFESQIEPRNVQQRKLEPEPEAKKSRTSSDYENYLMESYMAIKGRTGESPSTLENDPDFQRFVEEPKYREFLEKRKEKLKKFGII